MKVRHLVPFAILLAWQAAPAPRDSIPPRPRFSLSLGYALARFEDYTPAQFDCNGAMTSPERSEQVEAKSVGVRADMYISGGAHLTAFGGNTTSERSDVAGGFGGFQAAWEGRSLGLGLGVTAGVPSASQLGSSSQVNSYMRVGNVDRAHFRLEFLAPSEVFGAGGLMRVGMGFNQGGHGGTSGFAGVSILPYGSAAAFCDLDIPTAAGVDVLLRGQIGPGHINSPWSLGLGARVHFPR